MHTNVDGAGVEHGVSRSGAAKNLVDNIGYVEDVEYPIDQNVLPDGFG